MKLSLEYKIIVVHLRELMKKTPLEDDLEMFEKVHIPFSRVPMELSDIFVIHSDTRIKILKNRNPSNILTTDQFTLVNAMVNHNNIDLGEDFRSCSRERLENIFVDNIKRD
jgi:hypothetical protein